MRQSWHHKPNNRDAGEATSEYGEHFLCNTYKTLAIQHPQKEEQVSDQLEHPLGIRCSFGGGGGGVFGRFYAYITTC